MHRYLLVLPVVLAVSPNHVAAQVELIDETCVVNGSNERLLFVAEAGDGTRNVMWLEPEGRLCVPAMGERLGRVSAFLSEHAFEGCTRLTPSGEDTLLIYADFDRCSWSSMTMTEIAALGMGDDMGEDAIVVMPSEDGDDMVMLIGPNPVEEFVHPKVDLPQKASQ